jgi:hypothetical protein
MLLIVLAAALILAIALYQILQGVYTALIMAILTTLSAAVAFGHYERLAEAFLYDRMPAYADAAALAAIFVLVLLGLRLLADRFLGRNVVLGLWADRIVGGLLGLYVGMVTVGVLAVAVQMLPFGASVLGYRPFSDSLQRSRRLGPFYPDEFTLGLVDKLSAMGLSGSQRFTQLHDNLLLESFCARNTAERYGRVDVDRKARGDFQVFGAFEFTQEQWKLAQKGKRLQNGGELDPLIGEDWQERPRIIILRVAVGPTARDEDNWYRLPATHFRLVTGAGQSHYPVGYLTRPRLDDPWRLWAADVKDEKGQIARLCREVSFDRKHLKEPLEVYWVYVLPAQPESYNLDEEDIDRSEESASEEREASLEKAYSPAYLVFRRTARAEIDKPRQDELPR